LTLLASVLTRRRAIWVFLAFAFAYFLSALIRAITATLSPTLTAEFALNSSDLGLLAGAYFLGFAATQLPLGQWLDRYGPKRVILCFLSLAVLGCLAFSWATGFTGLLLARIMCGAGVSACLMAPLTGYRRWFDESSLLRANSWMLMSGSLGMVASTLPVQWLMPIAGWRPLFLGLAALVLLAMVLIAWQAPAWNRATPAAAPVSYAEVWRHPYFRQMAPIGFFVYGGLLAMQTLWVVPFMTRVAGYTPVQAATGFFWINVAMLVTFWFWGLVTPRLAHNGWPAERLIAAGIPLSFFVFAIIIIAGSAYPYWSAAIFGLYCMSCSFISLAQPAVGMAFPVRLAGRALSAYNLVIFSGIFAIQWGIGLLIDAFKSFGFADVGAFQGAFTVYLLCCMAAYLHFMRAKSHNQGVKPHD
jgi:predicted MFS family arabinose efflux permease